MKTKKIKTRKGTYSFQVHLVDENGLVIHPPPGLMQLGSLEEVMTLHRERVRFLGGLIDGDYPSLPYGAVDESDIGWEPGIFRRPEDQLRFNDLRVSVTRARFSPPDWVQPIWQFSQTAQPGRFEGHRVAGAFLRGLAIEGDSLSLTIGPGHNFEASYTMGSDGLGFLSDAEISKLSIDAGEKSLLKLVCRRIRNEFDDVRNIRQAIIKHRGCLPGFSEQVYSHLLGVAGVVLTSDGYIVLVNRTPKVTSVNHGPNVTASGGVDFDHEAIEREGLPQFLVGEMLREAAEELGLKGLDCVVVPVGFVRELPRGGSPEFLFLIQCRKTVKEFVEMVRQHFRTDLGRKDFDRELLVCRWATVERLLADPEAASVIHHKALINLVLAREYLVCHDSLP